MLKYFKYEFRRNVLTIVVLSIICIVANLSSIGSFGSSSTSTWFIAFALCMLCTIVPMMQLNSKFNKSSVDGFYSFPLRREKQYFVKILVGLIIVFIPYTAAYWINFIFYMSNLRTITLLYFIPQYFITLPLGVFLFGINSFVFTRANKIFDGVVFVCAYACIFMVISLYISTLAPVDFFEFFYWFTYSPIVYTFSIFSLLNGRNNPDYIASYSSHVWYVYLFSALLAAASYAGIFLLAKKEKPENAGQVSSSWFGYRVLIPLIYAFTLGIGGFIFYDIVFCVIITICAIISFIVYRRSFILKKEDWISLGIALAVGIILMLISHNSIHYIY